MRILLSFTLVALTWLIATPAAHSCLNGVIMEKDEVVKNVRLAQKALGKGQNKKVLRLLAADHYMVDSPRLMKQVRMLKAVARMRRGKTKGAERMFRKLLAKDKDNPLLQARLAEALHKRKGLDAIEAWRIMNDLESRDLVPDAQSFVVLARLRKRDKDLKGEKRAMAMCRVMAGDNPHICAIS